MPYLTNNLTRFAFYVLNVFKVLKMETTSVREKINNEK